MPELSRRNFLGTAAAVTGAAAVGAALPSASAAAAPTQKPGHPPKPYGDIRDVKHVIVIMQENRSFDHYFGAMKGVRGFGDRSTIVLPGGKTVWEQPKTLTDGAETQYPWRLSGAKTWSGATPPSAELGAANYGGTSHGWTDQHGAWYGGLMNGWYYAKGGPTTLGYLDRRDLPFHYALADAYTVGDAYHCSALSATGPNRTFLWGGTINADKKHGSFTAYDGGDERGKFLPWESYAETLQKAGVSWRVYQCADDYGDNGLEYFNTFGKLDPTQGGTAEPGNVFYDNGVKNVPEPVTGLSGNADNLIAAIRADVLGGTLPQVSWIVNNQFFSEHPVTAPSNGAYFLRGVLEALNADPDVFNSTVVIINYDENDGQFDHVPPPVPAAGRGGRVRLRHHGLVRRHRAAPRRARLPRAAHPRLALDPRRLGDLGGLRPHLGHPVHREVVHRARQARHLAQHQRLAAQGLRRPDVRLRLQEAHLRHARTAGDRAAHPRDAIHPAAGRQHDADPGGGHQAGAAAAVPAERQPGRVHRRAVRHRGEPDVEQRGPVRHQGEPLLRVQQPRRDPVAGAVSGRVPGPVHGRRAVDHVRDRRRGLLHAATPRTTSPSSARTGSCAGSPATSPPPVRTSSSRRTTTTASRRRTRS